VTRMICRVSDMKDVYIKSQKNELRYSREDLADVFNPISRDWHIVTTDMIVEVEDAEMAGAEKLREALNYISELNKAERRSEVEEVFGTYKHYRILERHSAKDILSGVEKLKRHKPEPGDIYRNNENGEVAVVLKSGEMVKLISEQSLTIVPIGSFHSHYRYTGKHIDVSELMSALNKVEANGSKKDTEGAAELISF